MNKLLTALVFLLTLALAQNSFAQDPAFSQFYRSGMQGNPARVGSFNCPTISGIYRNQWPDLSGSFTTTGFSYEMRIPKINGAFGFQYQNDNAANIIFNNQFNLVYGHRIKLNELEIRPALNFGINQKKINFAELTFANMIDPRRGFVINSSNISPTVFQPIWYFSVSPGILLEYKKVETGFSAFHLNRPNASFDGGNFKEEIRWTAHISRVFNEKNDWSFGASLLFNKQQDFFFWSPQVAVSYKYMRFGLASRFSENLTAVTPYLGASVKAFDFAYSYDSYVPFGSSAHELSIIYRFKCSESDQSRKKLVLF